MSEKRLIEIDLTLARDGTDAEKRNLARTVVEQFYHIGFLRCVNIPGYDEAALLRASNWFHLDHCKEEKMKYTTIRFDPKVSKMYRGYFPIIPNQNSHKECFEIGQWDETETGSYESPLQQFLEDPANWPDFEPRESDTMTSAEFRQIVRGQFDVYFNAARQLLQLISLELDIDMGEFDDILEGHATTFRLIHNPPRTDIIPPECKLPNGDVISVGEHHDTSIMTLLANYRFTGLQVQDNETKQWQNIVPKPDSFVVNCGILLEKMTQGRLRSTIHRVLDHNEERMSAPFFVEPGWNKELYEIKTKKRWSDKVYGRWMIDYVKKFVEYKNLPADL